MFENLPRLNGKARVELIVNGASIVIEVDGDNAPITAGNFIDLVERGVYDGVAFHRVITEPTPFVAQGGDPQSLDPTFPIENLGTGGFIDPDTGERRTIPLEIKLEGDEEPTYSTELGRLAGVEPPPDVVLEHERGAVAMARSTLPDSASSQFYFALDELEFLDGDYAVFGNVIEGLDVVDSIEQGDRITDAEVMIGNFTQVIGDSDNNTLNGLDLQIVFGLAGDDSLSSSVGSLPGGEETTILVGGSGDDEYQIAGNSTAIIFENGNSSQDVAIATGLTISSNAVIAEIDNRHLYVGNPESDQYAILVDWQEPENRIESFVLSDFTFSYEQLASTFSGLNAPNFTWEELEQQDEINLERLGLTPSSIDDAINQVSARASELEAPVIDPDSDLNTPIYRFQNSDIPGTYLFVAEEERANILENFTNFEEEGLAFRVAVEPGDNLIPLYRFQSTITPGTYLLAGEQERASINQDFADSFIEEGLAFYVYEAGSGLGTDFSRFQNRDRPGTYLFATGEERANIRENFTNFEEEGIAFEVDI